MKIEIVPEGNSTKRQKSDWGFSTVFDMVFGSVRGFVDTIFESIAEGVEEVISTMVRMVFALALSIIGLWFLLSGFAKLLDFLYATPGVGDIMVGSLVLFAGVVVALFIKVKRNR